MKPKTFVKLLEIFTPQVYVRFNVDVFKITYCQQISYFVSQQAVALRPSIWEIELKGRMDIASQV